MPLVEEVRVIVDRGPLQIIAGHEVAANFNGKFALSHSASNQRMP